MKAGDELEGVTRLADDERHEHPLQRDRAGERLHVRVVEHADVLGHADPIERDPAPELGSDSGHLVLLNVGPAPLAGRSPATRTPARACHHRVAGRPPSGAASG